MKLVIDLDQHEAIQDFSIGAPANNFEFKSQDTIDWLIYFVRGGVPQDLGSGMAIKMGMIKTGDTTDTILAYQASFTYVTDPVTGWVYYKCQVNYNTSQMAAAMAGQTQLDCTTELRYQSSDGEIVHTLNIDCLVFPTILVETGVTPPNVSTGYPDASTIELLVHKNVNNGYAGLDASGKVLGSTVPVDGITVVLIGGKVSEAPLCTTTADFTTPVPGGTVNVVVDSSANLKANQYVRIPTAGYYIVQSITDAHNIVLENNSDPFNAPSGVIMGSGTFLFPAQAAAGGGGAQGQAAYTTTTASFVVPPIGGAVNVAMQSTAWLAGSGYVVFITNAGYYAVNSVTDSQHASLTNLGYPLTNASAGSTISAGAEISPGGLKGADSTTPGGNAYDNTTANFTMPNAGVAVNIAIGNTNWLGINQEVFVVGAGYFSVQSIVSPTVFAGVNSNYPGNAAPGSTINSGARVSPAGVIGPQGAGGPGLNSYTTLQANYTQPAVGSTVVIQVGSTSWMGLGGVIYVPGGGYYSVSQVQDLTHVVATNLGYAGINVAPGNVVSSTGNPVISAGGVIGPAGVSPTTTTSASFTVPPVGNSVVVSVATNTPFTIGQNAYVQNIGYFVVANTPAPGQVTLTNSYGANPATVVASGTQIGATGPAGQAGPAGPTGATGPTATPKPDNICAHLETPTVKTYTLDLSAPCPYTITSIYGITGAGSATITLLRNGTAVTGASGLSITTTLSSVTTLNQSVVAGDKVQLQVTAVSSATDLQIAVGIQK